MTGVVRFLALKRKLGWDQDPIRSKYSCYTCRHTFAHRMLSGYWTNGVGCSIETLAELIGDTPKVAFDHYGKEWGQHYQDPLWTAIGVGPAANGHAQANRLRAENPSGRLRGGWQAAASFSKESQYQAPIRRVPMETSLRQRRRPRGSAWHWKQTDCWYYTPPGTQRRVPLFDETGQRIRGVANRQAAELALARKKLARQWRPTPEPEVDQAWLVAQVCSEYIEVLPTPGRHKGAFAREYRNEVVALPQRSVYVLRRAAGGAAQEGTRQALDRKPYDVGSRDPKEHDRHRAGGVQLRPRDADVPNPLKGLKKPPSQPRLSSLTPADEEAVYQATDEAVSQLPVRGRTYRACGRSASWPG